MNARPQLSRPQQSRTKATWEAVFAELRRANFVRCPVVPEMVKATLTKLPWRAL